jgi:hypothetical protein
LLLPLESLGIGLTGLWGEGLAWFQGLRRINGAARLCRSEQEDKNQESKRRGTENVMHAVFSGRRL